MRRWSLLAILFLGGAGCARPVPVAPVQQPPFAEATTTAPVQVQPVATDRFVDVRALDVGFRHPVTSVGACPVARAAVVNHHVLASDLIAGVFLELARCRTRVPTDTVIILSPDHWHAGTAPVMTHRLAYDAEGKTVAADEEAVSRLEKAVPETQEVPDGFRVEHGVGALVPFLSRVFPDAEVVGIIVRSTIQKDEAGRLSAWLAEEGKRPGTVVVVSSDMSHYLDADAALKHDEDTRKAFEKNDAAFFWNATDDNVDNGKGIAVLMNARFRAWRELGHSISSDYGGSRSYTTSYFTGVWE